MALPVVSGKDFHLPSVLAGQANGKLPASLLATIAMPGGGTARVLAVVAPKWRAMLDAAAREGFRFSQNGDYRPYAEQESIFRARYTTNYIPGAERKTWQNVSWYKLPGVATAATPGTSNHGWGLALDLAMSGGGSLTDAAVAWLVAHAGEYGISAEIQSEDWHWRPYDGDAMASAVTRFVALSTQEEDGMFLVEFTGGEEYVYGVPGVVIGGLPVLVPVSGPWEKVLEWKAAGVRLVTAGVPLTRSRWHITEVDAWPDPTLATAVAVDAAAVAAALVADPGFKALLVESSFEGAQQAEKE